MDIRSLPETVQNKIFFFLSHPVADIFKAVKNDRYIAMNGVFRGKRIKTYFFFNQDRDPELYEQSVKDDILEFKNYFSQLRRLRLSATSITWFGVFQTILNIA